MKLEKVKDDVIIVEAVKRLKKKIEKQTGIDLDFGEMIIKIHDGSFNSFEFELRGRCFSKKSDNFSKFLLRNMGTHKILVFHSYNNMLTSLEVNSNTYEPSQ